MGETFNIFKPVKVVNKVSNIDGNYGPYTGDTLQLALETAHTAIGDLREIGVTVGILFDGSITEYWYKSGTTLNDLVIKNSGGTLSNTAYDAFTVLAANIDNTPVATEISQNSVLGRTDGNIGSLNIDSNLNDGVSNNHDTIPSAKAVKAYVDLISTSPYSPQGGYDAYANNPRLDDWTSNPSSGILKDWMWTVIVQGTFFTESVHVGDYLISKIDNPLTITDWIIVHNDLAAASESVPGIAEIADSSEMQAGTSDVTIVTPKKLKDYLGVDADKSICRRYKQLISNTLGTSTTFKIIHGLNTRDVVVQLRDTVFPYPEVEVQVTIPEKNPDNPSIDEFNMVILDFTLPPENNKYSVTIIG